MRKLPPGYTAAIDTVDERAWFEIIRQFDDANIYQTWTYDAVRCGRQNLSHFLLLKNSAIVAAAQSRILKIPFINVGIAYIRWGPLWRLRLAETNVETLRQAIRGLYNEYVCKRGLVLRLYPLLFDDDFQCFSAILKEEGFSGLGNAKRDRTMLIDLSRPLEDLLKDLKPSWRRQLHRAEKNELEIIEGFNDELFEKFINIYREMVSRKKFLEPNDINEFRLIQEHLPENFKMKIMLCQSRGNLCAGLVCSAMGKTGIYLFGATSDSGMESRGSYLLHWKLIEWLKNNGYSSYDLHGIDPVRNPGLYRFKTGLCEKNGKEVYFLGRFDSCKNTLGYSCVKFGDALRTIYRTIKRIVKT